MARPNRAISTLTAGAVATVSITLGARSSNRPSVWANNFDAVFSIEATGHLYNGSSEKETGTGFFITPDGLALTANHVVFTNKDNYKSIEVLVSLPGRAGPLPAKVIHADTINDVALLSISGVQGVRRVRMGEAASTAIGSDVDVIGYPLGLSESIVGGELSAKPKANAWQMSAPVNPGTSGGPVFDDEIGTAIGLVTAGITKVVQPDGSVYWVEGIKYFVPFDAYAIPDGLLQGDLSGLIGAMGHLAINESPTLTAPAPSRTEPEIFTRGYQVSFQKSDHPVLLAPHDHEYVELLQAEQGYRITEVIGVSPISVNHASAPRFAISPDGRTLTVRVKLTSGPWIDRYRAWYDATILTRQKRESH